MDFAFLQKTKSSYNHSKSLIKTDQHEKVNSIQIKSTKRTFTRGAPDDDSASDDMVPKVVLFFDFLCNLLAPLRAFFLILNLRRDQA
jgi:hypothetical protein